MLAAGCVGGATTSSELCRARETLCAAADFLAAVCRDAHATHEDVATAEDRVSVAFADYGREVLALISAGRLP